MCSPAVLDKDGVSAAAIAGEFVSYLASKNMTLSHQLRSIYEEYVTKTSALTSLIIYVLNLLVNQVFTLSFSGTVTTFPRIPTSSVTTKTLLNRCLSVFGTTTGRIHTLKSVEALPSQQRETLRLVMTATSRTRRLCVVHND